MERDDVVIVATVSAIYGLGDPATYRSLMFTLRTGEARGRDAILGDLVAIQYNRNDVSFEPGTFRVRGDTVATMMTSSRSMRLDVARSRRRSMSSLIDASFSM